MEINFDNLNQAIAALEQCASENKGKLTDTAAIRVSDLCNDVATFLRGMELHDVLQYGEEGTFGQAVECLKLGFKVARKGWNGKGMWLWLKHETMVKSEWCHDTALKAIADQNGGEIHALGTICMKTADNKILTGWLASQTDMLSEDWVLVDPNE